MNDEQRFALHFGPYQTPLFSYDDIVMDEVRGEVASPIANAITVATTNRATMML